MRFRSELSEVIENLPEHLHEKLPRTWRRIGPVAIVQLDSSLTSYCSSIGNAILKILSKNGIQTIAVRILPTDGIERLPALEIVAGEKNTSVVHKELGCYFHLDPLKITFSSGNHGERVRMIKLTSKDSCLVDMFACVGNLSLAPTVHNVDLHTVGIEINPTAYSYLRKNVETNGVEQRYLCVQGDNRSTTPLNIADRVILGYWGVDEEQMETALKALKSETGGWIHHHFLRKTKKRKDSYAPLDKWRSLVKEQNRSLTSEPIVTHVKWVAKCLSHSVLDLEVT